MLEGKQMTLTHVRLSNAIAIHCTDSMQLCMNWRNTWMYRTICFIYELRYWTSNSVCCVQRCGTPFSLSELAVLRVFALHAHKYTGTYTNAVMEIWQFGSECSSQPAVCLCLFSITLKCIMSHTQWYRRHSHIHTHTRAFRGVFNMSRNRLYALIHIEK